MPSAGTEVRALPPELQHIARVEQNETPERRERDVQHLKEWISKQPHLPQNVDDQFFVTYLRGCKYSLELCKEKIDFFFSVHTALPEFFCNRDPFLPELLEVQIKGYSITLPLTTPKGCRVAIGRIPDKEVSKFKVVECWRVGFMKLEALMQFDDFCVVNGLILVFDLANFSVGHLASFPLPFAKKVVVCLKQAFAVRIKAIHFINAPPIADKLVNLVKPFMRKKVQKRVYVHGKNLESLYDHLPRKMLPKDYGGEEDSMDELARAEMKMLEKYRNFLINSENLKTIESLRMGVARTQSDLFGIEGSFRQLTVD